MIGKPELSSFAPPALQVEPDIDYKTMPPPPATGISPRGAFTPTSALMGGLKSPAMTRPNLKLSNFPMMSPYRGGMTGKANESQNAQAGHSIATASFGFCQSPLGILGGQSLLPRRED